MAVSTAPMLAASAPDRKSTRLNSSHSQISYAVFCLKKKKIEREAARARRGCDRDTGNSRLAARPRSSTKRGRSPRRLRLDDIHQPHRARDVLSISSVPRFWNGQCRSTLVHLGGRGDGLHRRSWIRSVAQVTGRIHWSSDV